MDIFMPWPGKRREKEEAFDCSLSIAMNIHSDPKAHTPSSNVIWIAPFGQTEAQIPHPLQ